MPNGVPRPTFRTSTASACPLVAIMAPAARQNMELTVYPCRAKAASLSLHLTAHIGPEDGIDAALVAGPLCLKPIHHIAVEAQR